MLHNKYYEIIKQFLGDYSREIYGRELIGKVRLSQKGIALALEELEDKYILKSRKQGTLKYYKLNHEYTGIKDFIKIAEMLKKTEFFSKQRAIAHLLKHDNRIVGIFGSYAKGTQKKDSDVDIFIIGKKKAKDYDEQDKKLDLDISIKYFNPIEWRNLLRKNNNLCKEIISCHILVFGVEAFIDSAWSDYYGFS